MIIVTNNVKVRDFFQDREILFVDGSVREVFVLVRDYVHRGHALLTHPLSGSVKPGENPFKTIAVTREKGVLDFNSLNLVEEAIIACDKFSENTLSGMKWQGLQQKNREGNLTEPEESIITDFREIDFALFAGSKAAGKN